MGLDGTRSSVIASLQPGNTYDIQSKYGNLQRVFPVGIHHLHVSA